ncbi:MAG: hypothetical protein AB7Q17_15645 [Phycisphaerae bacterium]
MSAAAGSSDGAARRAANDWAQRAGGVRYALATADDDADLRALLRENPMGGAVRVALEREPSYFACPALEGDEHATILARDTRTGRAVAMGGWSVRTAYLNGVPARLAYLCHLRVAREYRRRPRLVIDGYRFLRAALPADAPPFLLTSVVADNREALRLLERGLPGMPAYDRVADFVTQLLPVIRRRCGPRSIAARGAASGGRLRPAEERDAPAIVDCLARNHVRYQFAPVWTRATLGSATHTPGLRITDFIVIERAGDVVGCAALWDQRAFKQAVIRGYAPALARWRWLVNAFGPLAGIPPLPAVGVALRYAFISHLAADGDDCDALAALVRALRTDAARRGLDAVLLGLAADHPWRIVAGRFGGRAYPSMLFAVSWPEGRGAVAGLDARIVHPELSLL